MSEDFENKYHEIMNAMIRSRREHGDCTSWKRYDGVPRACSACMAERKIQEEVKNYKGRPVKPSVNSRQPCCPACADDNEPITVEWLRDVAEHETRHRQTTTFLFGGDDVAVVSCSDLIRVQVNGNEIGDSRVTTRGAFRQLCWLVGVDHFRGAW